jgi:acylphosphatase
MSGEIVAVHARIEGKVQRVWYRNWTVESATKRGLTGWVRNRSDGTVEAVFAGPRDQVEDMMKACWQGSTKSEVTNVIAEACELPTETGFREIETL